MKVESGLFYTDDHEWIKFDGDTASIGISDYAQDNLGDIVYVEFLEEEGDLDIGDEFAAIESVKAASDAFMPVAGKIIEVNTDLESDPGLINEDAYKAWLIKIEPEDAESREGLMDADEYKKFLGDE